MTEITCGARLRALSWRENHEVGLKMKLLSPGDTQSHAHKLIVHSCHCFGAAHVTGTNGLICESHVLLEGGVSPWQPAPSLARSLDWQRALESQDRGFFTVPRSPFSPGLTPEERYLFFFPSVPLYSSFPLTCFCLSIVFFVLHPSQNPLIYLFVLEKQLCIIYIIH